MNRYESSWDRLPYRWRRILVAHSSPRHHGRLIVKGAPSAGSVLLLWPSKIVVLFRKAKACHMRVDSLHEQANAF